MLKYYKNLPTEKRKITLNRTVASNISLEGQTELAKKFYKKAEVLEAKLKTQKND